MEQKFDEFKFFKRLHSKLKDEGLTKDYSSHFTINESGQHSTIKGISLQHAAIHFVKIYYKSFGEAFLRRQRHFLNSSQSRLLTYFLSISDPLLDDLNSDYVNDIFEVCDLTKIDPDIILNKIQKIMPISDRTDIWLFIAKKLFDESYVCLSVLLLASVYSELECLDMDSEDDRKEFRDIQKDFLHIIFQIVNKQDIEKTISKILLLFTTINKFSIGKYKFVSTTYQIIRLIPFTTEQFVFWDKVSFFNGFYHLPQPNSRTDFFSVTDPRSRQVFNELKPYFLKKIPPIWVERNTKGQIVKVLNTANLDDCITMLECQTIASPKVVTHNNKLPSPKRKNLDKTKAHEFVKQFKSRFVETLCNLHLDAFKVICCIENRINSNGIVTPEYAFIFTIREDRGLLTLAFENSEDSRCTYLFKVPINSWNKAADLIFDFFSSNSVNKRQAMARRLADLRLPGNYDYGRVMHTDFFKWRDRIKYF